RCRLLRFFRFCHVVFPSERRVFGHERAARSRTSLCCLLPPLCDGLIEAFTIRRVLRYPSEITSQFGGGRGHRRSVRKPASAIIRSPPGADRRISTSQPSAASEPASKRSAARPAAGPARRWLR